MLVTFNQIKAFSQLAVRLKNSANPVICERTATAWSQVGIQVKNGQDRIGGEPVN
jgi:hypothetical protein